MSLKLFSLFRFTVFFMVLLLGVQAKADTLFVTNLNDSYFSYTGKTLRMAIGQARSGDEIVIRGTGRITLRYGELDIRSKDINIRAANPGDIIIDADNKSRIFDIYDSRVTLRNLTMVNGYSEQKGGAIFTDFPSTMINPHLDPDDIRSPQRLYVLNCQFTNNRAQDGGAIFSNTSMTVLDSTFYFNQAIGGEGGAIYMQEPYYYDHEQSTVDDRNQNIVPIHMSWTINRSYFSNNRAEYAGAVHSKGGWVWMRDTTFYRNFARGSAGMSVVGHTPRVDLFNTDFKNNSASFNNSRGGALTLDNVQEINIERSEFLNNSNADGNGGAISFYQKGRTSIKHSTFANNSADRGGAVYIHQDVLGNYSSFDIVNTTISGNSANNGGGIFRQGLAPMLLHHVTLTKNRATTSSSSGIYTYSDYVTARNSIIADNYGDDCYGILTIKGKSLLSNERFCDIRLADSSSGKIIGQANLTALGYYSSDTQTHGLSTNSKALNGTSDCILGTDQRYKARPLAVQVIGATCDIGAHEN